MYGAAANPQRPWPQLRAGSDAGGRARPGDGMVFDLKELKEILNAARSSSRIDHRFLNHEVPPFDR